MIIDSSVIIAIVGREPGHEWLRDQVAEAEVLKMGSPTMVEAGMVLVGRHGIRGKTVFARFLQDADIEVLPFTDEHAEVAIDAFYRFGKGRHPAKLNMGDCFTYATAYVAREPLLFIGDDFTHTDLQLVRTPSSQP
jgi:ribonuclease VapC